MKVVTITDVADHSGVSISTVSHVVNGTRFVAPATKERVQRSIEALGYVANAAARNLKSGSLHMIAMIVERSSNPFFAEIVQAFESECAKRNFLVTISICDSSGPSQLQQYQFLRSRGADGFAILLANVSDELMRLLELADAPPSIALDAGRSAIVPIINDNSLIGGRLAANHLLEIGRRRALILGGPKGHSRMNERINGFVGAWIAGGPETPPVIRHCPLTYKGGYDAILQLASEEPGLAGIDCVMGLNDTIAIGAMAALQALGKQIPEDIAVVGYDDIELCRYVHPPLTSVAQNIFVMGRRAAGLLIDTILGTRDKVADTAPNEPKLAVRCSSRPAASDPPDRSH